MAVAGKFAFGPFQFEPCTGRLTKHGQRIRLQPRAAAVLKCLLERPGEIVTRAQIQKRLWSEGTYVDFDLGIKVAVRKLRDALSDSAEQPKYVQTIHGEGYRFIGEAAPVPATELEPPESPPAFDIEPTSSAQASRLRWRHIWAAVASVAVFSAAFAAMLMRHPA